MTTYQIQSTASGSWKLSAIFHQRLPNIHSEQCILSGHLESHGVSHPSAPSTVLLLRGSIPGILHVCLATALYYDVKGFFAKSVECWADAVVCSTVSGLDVTCQLVVWPCLWCTVQALAWCSSNRTMNCWLFSQVVKLLSRLGTQLGRFLPTCARQLDKVAVHDTAYQKEILALTLAWMYPVFSNTLCQAHEAAAERGPRSGSHTKYVHGIPMEFSEYVMIWVVQSCRGKSGALKYSTMLCSAKFARHLAQKLLRSTPCRHHED